MLVIGVVGTVGAGVAAYVGRTFLGLQETIATHMRSHFEQAQETSRYLVAENLIERLTLSGGHLAEIRMRRGVTVDMMVGYGCLR